MPPNPLPPVSACLLSWKRARNLPVIIQRLEALDFVDEILVWNNDPATHLDVEGGKVRVLTAERNEGCYGRYLCARQARNEHVYVQDDDVVVEDVPRLYEAFLRDPSRMAHALSPYHFERRERKHYGDCHMALVGWGAFLARSWVDVLDRVPEPRRKTDLFRREADKYFSILLERHHQTLLGRLRHLDGHSKQGQALWLEGDHPLMVALAVREALALVRTGRTPRLPVPFHVVIPCRDYARYLGEAVESVLHNDADYVLTIVDDASTDDTPAVARALASQHPHVRYLRLPENVGPGAAINRAVSATDSVFVVRLDADDRLGPDYLHEAGKLLGRGADVANVDALLFGDKRTRWPVPHRVELDTLLRHNPVHCASAFRRGYWAQVGGFDEKIPGWEDYELWIRMAAAGARIRRLPGDHFHYRKHGTSRATGSTRRADELRAYLRRKHASLYQRTGRSRAS